MYQLQQLNSGMINRRGLWQVTLLVALRLYETLSLLIQFLCTNCFAFPLYLAPKNFLSILSVIQIFISSHLLLLFSHSVMSDSLQSHGLQPARLPCPSPSPRVYSNSDGMVMESPTQWTWVLFWAAIISQLFSLHLISSPSLSLISLPPSYKPTF